MKGTVSGILMNQLPVGPATALTAPLKLGVVGSATERFVAKVVLGAEKSVPSAVYET